MVALPRDARLLLVASSGGHLAELLLLADALNAHPDSRWVTFRTEQSESLLRDRSVTWVPYVAPRDWRAAARTLPTFHRLLAHREVEAVVSTGAAIAVPAVTAAHAARTPAHFVESVARFDGPSLAGRLVALHRKTFLWTHHPGPGYGGRWHLDVRMQPEQRVPRRGPVAEGRQGVLVTLGTIRPYRFDALVDRVLTLLPAGVDVTWQLGSTTRHDLPGTCVESLPYDEFVELAGRAATVVSHAGMGSVLDLAGLGVRPVVVPRRAARGEHVDDHQLQVVRALGGTGLGVFREVDEITSADLAPARVIDLRDEAAIPG